VSLVAIECFVCGVAINVTATYEANRHSDRQPFYCPNGHPNVFPGESDKDKAARLERVVGNLSENIDHLYDEKERLRGQVKKLRADARAAKASA
jgi:hypothetical protein